MKNVISSIYTDGRYLEKSGGTWHIEDSQFKAREVAKMILRHPEIELGTVCEVGCGAGAVLHELQKLLPQHVSYTGYEISPQAHQLSENFQTSRCEYILGDAFASTKVYSLVLVLDVIEHVEDCFEFLRNTKAIGRRQLLHIPIDAYASSIMRGANSFESAGHIHTFTMETALESIKYSGLQTVDWVLTRGAVESPRRDAKTRTVNVGRRILQGISPKLAARVLGGYSILALTE